MRVLILGATGMFGNAAYNVFASDPDYETWGTLRSADDVRFFRPSYQDRLIHGVDVLDHDALVDVMRRVRPTAVINAVGVIKQLASANNPLVVLPINSLFPHRLADLCDVAGARLVQISTDCVFSGDTGGYLESDPSDATDLYGKSKYIGELHHRPNAVTLRTSGIGHELKSAHGLLEWFLAQTGRVRGYAKAIYSGLTWVELARVIKDVVLARPDLCGLYHVSSKPIAKLDLLMLVAEVYGKEITIERDDSVCIDRSLNSERFTQATGYVAPDWPTLVADMYQQQFRAASPVHV